VIVSLLLKIKQINDVVLNYIQQKPLLTILPQRLLIYIGGILDYIVTRIQPYERTEIKQQQTRQKQFVSR
jgi:hypothetical protein